MIPDEVITTARTYAGLGNDADLYAVEIAMNEQHRTRPLLTNAQHLWRVDMPGSEIIHDRREEEYKSGAEPAYTLQLMSVFVVQLADGTYTTDGILQDEDPE
jgi:hypothetical protein